MARKWQRRVALGRKRISSPRTNADMDAGTCSTSVADKGHFVVYTTDKRRFMIPLVYLSNNIFRELFKMSEEEFGLQSDGPITLPCDSVFMQYILPVIQRGVAKDMEKALIFSLATSRCSQSSFHQEHISQHLLKLIRMARKWQKVAALGRKRILLQRINREVDADSCSTSTVADKGHFVVYTSDRKRFVIPLAYLDSEVFRDLFQMSEDEFGMQSAGPIILPCDSVFMDYVISFIQQGVAKDLERALIMSIASSNCSSSSYFHQEQNNEPLLLCAF
ncbi:hypothetical protein PVL29_002948 [Vitis rotundifolia]|uniref:Auxin-responsive protein SAUR66 n=1 Tax=Vitis rotundifolia TaxID=103349 RepID=A0AA39AE38_VITRO|nr:hypothetical protein PVL29_002948 [Vitis rotundifolia]